MWGGAYTPSQGYSDGHPYMRKGPAGRPGHPGKEEEQPTAKSSTEKVRMVLPMYFGLLATMAKSVGVRAPEPDELRCPSGAWMQEEVRSNPKPTESRRKTNCRAILKFFKKKKREEKKNTALTKLLTTSTTTYC
jgi:hypothetical protein